MAEFDNGVTAEEAGIDVGEYDVDTVEADVVEDASETEEVEEAAEDNPWSWVDERGVTPEVVRDSFEKFTQKHQELSAKEASLAPYKELMDELQKDAALQQVIRNYYASGQTPDKEIANLSAELRTMQTQISVEKEFGELEAFVASEKLPEFDKDELLDYAVEHNMPSLASAYKDMMFDNARKTARESLEQDIKKGKTAALPKSGRGDGAGKTKTTVKDIADMSEEEFISGYQGIVKGIVGS